MNDDLKARFCEALGVTVEEVDEIDRAMHGPEVRAQKAKDEADYKSYLLAMKAVIEDELSALLPEGFRVSFGETEP